MTGTTGPADAPAPAARRARPAKPPLSRDWIIAETIRIMRQDGLQAATMRRVAQALDTGQSSLYVYVANTTELHSAVLDELMGKLRVRGTGDWSRQVRRLLHDYRDLLLTHPGLARSALTLRSSGPNTLRFLNAVLGLLLDGGMPADQAAWNSDLLLLYTTALAAEHGAQPVNEVPRDDEAFRARSAAVVGADRRRYPHVTHLAGELIGGTPEQRWEWALSVLLAGGNHIPTPLATATTADRSTGKQSTTTKGQQT